MSVLGKLLRQQFGRSAASSPTALPAHRSGDTKDSKIFLYVGCGKDRSASIRHGFIDGWEELRLDIDASVRPHLVGNLLDMSNVRTASVDVVYSAHTLEHLFAHEVGLPWPRFGEC